MTEEIGMFRILVAAFIYAIINLNGGANGESKIYLENGIFFRKL